MNALLERDPETQRDEPTHAHRWRIDEPQGEVSHGLCRLCGAQREFRNWLPELDYISRREAAWNTAA
jgi:hypothetical protein